MFCSQALGESDGVRGKSSSRRLSNCGLRMSGQDYLCDWF
jgi:hypothetical protein